jgi:hypothetical protein
MPTLLQNFLIHFHGAGLGVADGSNGPHALGPHTPGGYVKQIAYSVRIHNIQHLKQRIREDPDVLGRMWQKME